MAELVALIASRQLTDVRAVSSELDAPDLDLVVQLLDGCSQTRLLDVSWQDVDDEELPSLPLLLLLLLSSST